MKGFFCGNSVNSILHFIGSQCREANTREIRSLTGSCQNMCSSFESAGESSLLFLLLLLLCIFLRQDLIFRTLPDIPSSSKKGCRRMRLRAISDVDTAFM